MHKKSKRSPDVGLERMNAQKGVPLRYLIVALIVFYCVAGVLNGRHLYEAAELRPYGTARKVWLIVLKPIHAISKSLRLDFFREQIEKIKD